jgi:hypothetical protein
MFQYYDTILEGDIIPVQHKGDLLYYAYLSCSNANGVMVPWDAGSITHVEWYIGARLIDRYPLKMPHVAKTYSELSETRLFQPLRFSYPIPMVCLQYEKMYLKVIGAPKASLRYTCHMVYMNLTPDERMKIATEPYSMHIEQHHEVNPDQLYIHAPIKYFITSDFQYTNVDSIELVVNGQRTSGPILPEYFSPYITPAELRSISYPTPQTIVKASGESRQQVKPPSELWISERDIRIDYDIVTSASSNSTFAYAATTTLGWISDPGKFGEETVYTVTASLNPTDAYKSTTSEGWTSDAVFGNTVSGSANIIVGSNVNSRANLISATSYWLADTTYTADAKGKYNVVTSTGTLSNANVWNSSNTFGTRIPDGEYSIVPSDAWPVLDENATTFWANTQFGQTLYMQSITGNNASSNLNLNVVPAKLFDAVSQSGWVSNSAANVYGYGSNAGVYASAAWRAFDRDDTTSWTGGNEFQAQSTAITNTRMNAFSNVSNAWLASDYNDATTWISNTLVYGHTLPSPFLSTSSPDLTKEYGRTANIVTSLTATSNTANVANALAWTNTLSWTSNLSFGQVTVPQGTYTYTLAPTTSYSNETVAAVTSLSDRYTGFSAYTNSSVYFVTNPIPGLYVTNISGAYDTTRISEATIATLVPAGQASNSRSNITGSLVTYTGAVTQNTPRIFNKFPSGTFTELTTIELLSSTTYTWPGVFNASDGTLVVTPPTLVIQGPTGSGTGNVAYTQPTGLTGTWTRSADFDSNTFTLTSVSTPRVYDTSSLITVNVVGDMTIQSFRKMQVIGTLTFPPGMVTGTSFNGTLFYPASAQPIVASSSSSFILTIVSEHKDFYQSAVASDAPNYKFQPRTGIDRTENQTFIYTKTLPFIYTWRGQNFFVRRINDTDPVYYVEDNSGNPTAYIDDNPPSNAIKIGSNIVVGFYGNPPGVKTYDFKDSLSVEKFYFPFQQNVTGKMLDTVYGDESLLIGRLYFIEDTGNLYFWFKSIANVELWSSDGTRSVDVSYDRGIVTIRLNDGTGRVFTYKIDVDGNLVAQGTALRVVGGNRSLLPRRGRYTSSRFIYTFLSTTFVRIVDTLNNTSYSTIPGDASQLFTVSYVNRNIGFEDVKFTFSDGTVHTYTIGSDGNLYGGPEDFNRLDTNLLYPTTNPSDIQIFNGTKVRFQQVGSVLNMIIISIRANYELDIARIMYRYNGEIDAEGGINYVESTGVGTSHKIMDYATHAYSEIEFVIKQKFTYDDFDYYDNVQARSIYITKYGYYTDELFAMPGFVPYSVVKTRPFGPTYIIMDRSSTNVYATQTTINSVIYRDGGNEFTPPFRVFYMDSNGNIIQSSEITQTPYEIPSHPTHIIITVSKLSGGSTPISSSGRELIVNWTCRNPNQNRNLIRVGHITASVNIRSIGTDMEIQQNISDTFGRIFQRLNTEIGGRNTIVTVSTVLPVRTENIRLIYGSVKINLMRAIYDISPISVQISPGTQFQYNSETRVLEVSAPIGDGDPDDLIITLTGGAQHIKRIRFTTDISNPATFQILLGTQSVNSSIVSSERNNLLRTFTHASYFTQNEFRFRYKATGSDINFNVTQIDLLDTHNGLIGRLTPSQTSNTISSGFRTSIPNIGVTASLNTSATTDQYRIQFDGSGTPTSVFNVTQNRNENLQLNGRFANATAAYTIFSNVAVSTVSPGTTTSHSHTDPPNSFRTVCSLGAVGWVPNGILSCTYTLAPYQDTTISLAFPRAVTVGRVDINSSYGPRFQIFNRTTPNAPITATRVGNTYTFGTAQSISVLDIRPSLPLSITPLTLSNIIVYDNIGCRISPSIPGTTLTMYSGGVRLAPPDGNVYTGYSFDASETRSLTNFRNKQVTFTTNVHANVASIGALLSITPTPTSISPSTVPNLSSAAIKNEFQLSFTIANWDGRTPVINSNVLVANVFEGGRNQANAFITLASQQVYGGVMSSNLGSLYTVSARNSDSAAWVPAVIGTSYSRYSYTVTQSNVYQPSVYFKLIRPSGVELHKDFVDGDTTVGLSPIGEYTLTPGVLPSLFTREGHTTPLNTSTVTLTFPRPVTVTRILVSGTSLVFNNNDNTTYANGEAILQTPVTSHTFTFSTFINVTRILLFNARGLITPRLVGTERTPTGNYWMSNTLSSNVLATPPVFGWTFPNANITGYTITSSQRLPYKLNVSSGAIVLDRWVNVNAESYTTLFPAPRQLTSLGCNVLELVDTSTIDCNLQLIVYSYPPITSTTTISSNIYGPPVFCTVSGPSVPDGSRTVISNLQSGTDITTFDFGANVVNIRDITYSTLTTLTTTPGLLRVLGPSVSVVGQIDTTATGAEYRGRMLHPSVADGTWNDIQWNSQFTLRPTSLTLGTAEQSDLYPFSRVGIQLGGTLGYTVISSLTYMVDGHLYAYRLENVGRSAIVNAVPGATFVSQEVSGVTYDRIIITFPHAISQIQIYGITVTATSPKPNWNIWCRPPQSGEAFGIVRNEGLTPSLNSVTSVNLPTQPPFSNIFGVRMSRTTPCHFSNIILYNDLGAAVNTNDVRGRGLESFSFTPQSPVQFKSYSFVSDPPITSWTLKHGLATIDSVLVNSNVNVYRELPTSVITSGAITLEISNAVGRAQISDFKLYSEAYQMVTSNATADVMYGSALAGRYAIYTSSSPTYQVNPMPFQTGFYTRVDGSLVEGPWIQIEMPIPIVVSKCFFYGNHRQYTLLQSSDGGASWTIVCTGDADVYREIPSLAPAQFFRFVCQSIYGTSWNVDIALCNSLGERLNARYGSGYIRYPNYFGGLPRSSPQTISYTVPSPLSNIYFRDTNVSNVIIGGRRTTMTVVSDGFRQFTPSTPITAGTTTNIVIDGIDNGTTATWTDIELLDATHRPMIHRGNVMVSTAPQGYYEFSGNRITFPVPVTPVYSNITGRLSGPTTRQYMLQNTQEILYDADFKRLTPLTRSNGFVRDIVYSGSNVLAQRQFIYFDAGSSRGANSYTFTCDPPPIRWTLECDGVAVHSQTTPNWSTNTTYTSLIQNGCTGRTFTLFIDSIQSTTSNTLRISSFGVYNDRGLLLTPQFTSNTETASRFYTSTQANGYFEVEPESQTDFVFNGTQSMYAGDIVIRLPCFVRIDRCTLQSGSAEFFVSADGSSSSWVAPSRNIMALYLKIERTSSTMQGLSVFINSTQCII